MSKTNDRRVSQNQKQFNQISSKEEETKTNIGTLNTSHKVSKQEEYAAVVGPKTKNSNGFNKMTKTIGHHQNMAHQYGGTGLNQESKIQQNTSLNQHESLDQLIPVHKPPGIQRNALQGVTGEGRETSLDFEHESITGIKQDRPSQIPDRKEELKLPEINQTGEKSVTIDSHKHNADEEQQNLDQGYTLEEQAKLQNVINLFQRGSNAAEQRDKAKAQNEQMKMMGDHMIEKEKNITNGVAYEFKHYKPPQFRVYDKNSLFCLKKGMKIRDLTVQLTCWPVFDHFIVLMIFINSAFMACYDYSDPLNKNKNNRVIEYAGHVFTITFTIECILKVLAMGFCFHKNSYLRDTWNWLDFAVVCVGVIEQIPGMGGSNLKALRTLRVLRPLRSINAFPSMKKIINSLLASLPALGNAVIFMMFIFLLFCILGVQSFSGVLYQRCRYDPKPVYDTATQSYTSWPIVEDIERLCSLDGSGEYSCPAGYTCGSPGKYDMTLESDGVPDSELIMYGIITFDNIVSGMITIFQVITLEGWSTLMYNLSDASPQWMSEIFCILLVLVGSFFLLNVILAVIMDAFDEVAAQEEDNLRKIKLQQRQLRKDYGYEVTDSEIEDQENSKKEEPSLAVEGKLVNDTSQNQVVPEDQALNEIEETKKKKKIPDRTVKNPIYKFFYIICSDSLFSIFITLCIILNTLLLATDKYPIQKEEQQTQQAMNDVLSWIFFGEMVIKLIGLGIKDYASDSFNLFDCAVVIVSLVENIIAWLGISFSGGGAISALRAIRLLRVFKLARSWTSFRELLEKIVITLKDIYNISILMLLFMFIFTLVGSEMYAYKVMFNNEDKEYVVKKDGVYPRENFNSLYQGLTTIFIVFIGEDWNSVMYDHYRATNAFTIVYFIFLFIFGNLILLNLFLGILLMNFSEPPGQDEEQDEEDEDGRLVRIKQCLLNKCPCLKKKTSTPDGEIEMIENSPDKELNIDQVDKNEAEEMFGQEDTSKKAFQLNSLEVETVGVAPSQNINQNETLSKERNFNPDYIDNSRKGADSPLGRSKKKKNSNTFSISQIKQQTVKTQMGTKSKDIELFGKSLILWDENNKFRIVCAQIVGHPNFDNTVLFMIIVSTILLAIEDPFENPESTKNAVMGILDIILSIIFLFELLIKVVVLGFAFNGADSYMRNSWNVMDFIIVFFSMVSLAFQDIDLGPIKILRMLRVLRPLRMISRNPGMKIAIQSLINAIPDIGNVMVVSLLFILLFAILATNFYKGKFYKCDTENIPDQFVELVKDKFDCMDFGGDWVNEDQNFDNIKYSLITLFNVMTTEGWIGVMWNAVDSTRINEVPVKNNDPLQIVFFMLYMIACSLFVLNMFVGIVINVFNREKEDLYMNHKLTQFQRDWCDVLVFCYNQNPIKRYELTGNKFKDTCYWIATHYILDNFIFFCIAINTICLTLTWYNEPKELQVQLEKINLIFNIIYTIEAMIKLIGFGQDYFSDGWNIFDFVIVLAAWFGTIANNIDGLDLGQSTTIIKSFRILRIFKIIKKYKSLRILFYTFIGAVQQLTNVGGLLFLFLFLYSVLGVFMFAGVKMQDVLNEHANFTGFHYALITLFRMATGESWHELMYDCARQRSIIFDCIESQDYYSFKKYGRQECGNPAGAYVFFISFMLVVSFIFLNLFIAIILESFNTSQNEEGLKITQQTLNSFSEHWSHYDKKAKCFISCNELGLLMDRLIEQEVHELYEARQKVNDGDMEKDEYENISIMFNLRKNEYLSGNVAMKLAEYSHERKCKEDEHNHDHTNTQVNLAQVVADEPGKDLQTDQDTKDKKEQLKQKETKKTLDRLMNYFIMSLKIPCYGKLPKKEKGDQITNYSQITNFYYYDILEALARDVFLRWIQEEVIEIKDSLKKQNVIQDEETLKENELDVEYQECKYCYQEGRHCPLYKILSEKHKNRYIDCEETDEDMEQQHDFLVGQIDPILGKLEDRGQQKDTTINKYQEMAELRAKRNIKSLDCFQLSEFGENIIDSSQMAAANIIIRFMKHYKEIRLLKKERALARAVRVAPRMWSKLGTPTIPTPARDAKKQKSSPIELDIQNIGGNIEIDQRQKKTSIDPISQKKKDNNFKDKRASGKTTLSNDNQQPNSLLQTHDNRNPFLQIIIADNDSPSPPNFYNNSAYQNNMLGIRVDSPIIQFIRDSEPGNKQGEDAF